MRKTDPARYSQRKLIGEEFKRLNYSEENMLAEHGNALKSIKRLMQSIRDKNSARETKDKESKAQEERQRQEEVSVMTLDLNTALQAPAVIQEPALTREEEDGDGPPLLRGRNKEKQVDAEEELGQEKDKEDKEGGKEGHEKQSENRSSTRRRQSSVPKPSSSLRHSKRAKVGHQVQ